MINIGARVSSFVQGCAAARVSLNNLASSVTAANSKFLSFSGALLGLAGAGGLTALIKHSLETIETMGNMADRLGVTTEALGGLRLGAELSDMSLESLETGLTKMLRAIDAARSGTKTAVENFDKLHLSAEKLAQMSPDQALAAIADGLKGVTNASERAAIAVELFGRGGLPMLNLLEDGAEGLRKFQEQAERHDQLFSREDAARVKAFNDALKDLGMSIGGIAKSFAIAIAGPMKKFVDMLQEHRRGIGQAIGTIAAFVAALTTIRIAQKAIAVGQSILLALAGPKGWATLAAAAVIGAGAYAAVAKAFDAVGESADQAMQRARDATASTESFGESLADKITQSVPELRSAVSTITSQIDALNDAFTEAQERFAHTSPIVVDPEKFLKSGVLSKEAADIANQVADARRRLESTTKDLQTAETALASDVASLTEELEKQVVNYGLSTEQIKINALATAGASEAQLAAARAWSQQLQVLEDSTRAQSSIDQMIDSLREHAATLGMDAAAIAQWKLAQLGADESVRQLAASLQGQIDAWTEWDSMVEQAGQVFEQTRTPFEKYLAELDHLDELLNAGLISWETYGRAVDQAAAALDAASNAKVPTPESRFDNIDTIFGQMRVASSSFDKPPTRKEQEKQTKEQVKTNQKLDRIIAIEEKKANEGFA